MCCLSVNICCRWFSVTSIRYEDRLDIVSNYILWKVRIIVILKEWKIWIFANTKTTKHKDKDELEDFEILEARARSMTSPYPIMQIKKHFYFKNPCSPSKHRAWTLTHTSTIILRLINHYNSRSALNNSLMWPEWSFLHWTYLFAVRVLHFLFFSCRPQKL